MNLSMTIFIGTGAKKYDTNERKPEIYCQQEKIGTNFCLTKLY